jgi:hypothetical protein
MANTTTRAQIRTQALEILSDDANSSVFTADVLNRLITQVELEVAEMWKWQFLRDKKLVHAPIFTRLGEDITTASTTALIDDTTNFETSGYVRINHDMIAYSGVSSTQITGVTNIDVSHEEGEVVFPLVSMPSDYHHLLDVYVQSPVGGTRMRKMTYRPEFQFEDAPDPLRYTILNVATSSYLQAIGQTQDDIMVIHYQKKPAVYAADSDISSFPDEYCYVIARMVAGKAKIYFDDDMDGMGTAIYTLAKDELLKMTKLYGQREQGMSRLIRTTYNSFNRTDGNGQGRRYLND